MAGSPILPRSKLTPVGGAHLIKKAVDAVDDALDEIEVWLIDRWAMVPVNQVVVNRYYVNAYRYEYQISIYDLQAIVDEMLVKLGIIPQDYFVDQVRAAYQQGTTLAVTNLANISDDYTRSITSVLTSEPYYRRVALVAARTFEEMKGFQGDLGVELSRVLREAVQDGINPREVAETIKGRFDVSHSRAMRIAQTEITGALRRANWDETQDAQEKLGLNTALLWISALKPTTRYWHAIRHGETYTVQQVREFYAQGANAINCFLPDTTVHGRFVGGSKAHYSGDVINVMTSGGRNITVTPNHPIMTTRGMVAAAEITESDYLVAYSGKVENLTGVSDLNGKIANARIDDVYSALSDIGHSFSRRVIAVDFHGDGKSIDKNIDIVNSDRALSFGVESKHFKVLDNLAFIKSNSMLHNKRPFYFSLFGVLHSAYSIMRRCCGFVSDSFGRMLPSVYLRIFNSSGGNANGFNAMHDGVPSDSVFFGESQNTESVDMLLSDSNEIKPESFGFAGVTDWPKSRLTHSSPNGALRHADTISNAVESLAGLAAFDKVVDIKRSFYAGHVYDLQEVSGIMVANGIIASNCYCSQTAITLNSEGKPLSPKTVQRLQDAKKVYFGE